MFCRLYLLTLLGAASWLCYLVALGLGDLRRHTIGFEITFFATFALYLSACAVILRPPRTSNLQPPASNYQLLITILFAVLFRFTLLPSRPTLSDDMYRYVWDGRVQANGLSPYKYPPGAAEVRALHRTDTTVWRYINRKEALTVYPPGAQFAYAIIWRVVGDNVTGFKAAFVIAELVGGLLLVQLFKHLGEPPERVLIYLWSPLLVFEVAHAGHVDGLILPFLIAAFWARAKARYWLLGLFLGAATMVKLFPIILLPALLPFPSWNLKSLASASVRAAAHLQPAFKSFTALSGVVAICYLPYAFRDAAPIGFLPNYFNENFNLGLARPLFDLADYLKWPKASFVNAITFGGLAVIGLYCVVKPAASPSEALTRCVWLMGWFTLFTQNLFSWYLLWLLPLIALFIAPGNFLGFRLTAALAWLIFSGFIMLSYLFFIQWRIVPWGQIAEYAPLYGLLIAAALRSIWPVPTGAMQIS